MIQLKIFCKVVNPWNKTKAVQNNASKFMLSTLLATLKNRKIFRSFSRSKVCSAIYDCRQFRSGLRRKIHFKKAAPKRHSSGDRKWPWANEPYHFDEKLINICWSNLLHYLMGLEPNWTKILHNSGKQIRIPEDM